MTTRPQPQDITALILCGGRGRRMGEVDKPLLTLPTGERMVDRITNLLSHQVSDILLVCGENAANYRDMPYRVITDRFSDAGPLAGLEAGLAACGTAYCFVCPGDTPGIAPDIVTRLSMGLGDAAVAIANDGDRDQHLFMLLRATMHEALSRALDAGIRSVGEWVASQDVARVKLADKAQFFNINTPEDLQAWQGR